MFEGDYHKFPNNQKTNLTESDLEKFKSAFITPNLIGQAKLFRANSLEGARIVGRKPKIDEDYSGIVFPFFFPGESQPHEFRLRRDSPSRELQPNGSTKETGKYLSPPGRGGLLYFVPGTDPAALTDPSVPVLVTEGEKKTIALHRFCSESGWKALPIGLTGVWNWRGKVGKEPTPDGGTTPVKGPIPALDRIPWDNRQVFIIFDSNLKTNESVRAARTGLTKELARRGALVKWVDLPELAGVNGVDDLLAHPDGGPNLLESLIQSASTPEQAESATGNFPYQVLEDGGIRWQKPTKDGPTSVQLSNFSARIVRQITEIDDIEAQITLELEAECRGRRYQFLLPAREFSKMEWPYLRIGADAIVFPGTTAKEHLRVGIQLLSGGIRKETVFKSTGWRKIDDQWVFLHGGGAVGNQSVSVELEAGMENYYLPAPPDQGRLTEAIRASLRFLDLADRRQTWPLLASVYTGPFSEMIGVDFLLWLHGVTGSRKSTLAALLLCHFGDFQRHSLPANFTSTGNSLERQAFSTKDVLFVVDDYAPPPDRKHAAAQEAAAHRLIRAVGDRRGRGRMNADTSLKRSMFPRGLVLVTAETGAPGHQSSAARCVEVQLRPGNVRLDLLTHAQETDAPRYAEAMAGFLAWIAPRYDDMRTEAEQWIRREATQFQSSHGRIPEACAKLLFGVWSFLRFAVETGAITPETQAALFAQAKQALQFTAERSNEQQEVQRPTAIFFDHLQTLLAQGAIYLVDRDEEGGFENTKSFAAQAGWVDKVKRIAYLQPNAALAEIKNFAARLGTNFPFDARTLGEYLDHENWLIEKKDGRSTVQIRIGDKRQWVWAVSLDAIEEKNLEPTEKCGDTGDTGDKPSQIIEKSSAYFVTTLSPEKSGKSKTGDKTSELSPLSPEKQRDSVLTGDTGDKINSLDTGDTEFVTTVRTVTTENTTNKNISENSPQPASSNGTPGPRKMRRVTI
ncbi:MAG: DUF3854 domain-containing protein [Acidobacteria bacterium]|nr:DUF3854 domain-containing protein [Acidobacteriota bacterium]